MSLTFFLKLIILLISIEFMKLRTNRFNVVKHAGLVHILALLLNPYLGFGMTQFVNPNCVQLNEY